MKLYRKRTHRSTPRVTSSSYNLKCRTSDTLRVRSYSHDSLLISVLLFPRSDTHTYTCSFDLYLHPEGSLFVPSHRSIKSCPSLIEEFNLGQSTVRLKSRDRYVEMSRVVPRNCLHNGILSYPDPLE